MKNIAVIGSGISGLTSAYLLSQKHQVTVFEKNSVIGGHTATIDVSLNGQHHAIDTGFIVFNDRTYPRFLTLLAQLGIRPQKTEMSFSVKNQQTGLEYNGHTLATLFAQKRNVFNPRFWTLLREILRFNRLCKGLYASNKIPAQLTLGEFLQSEGFSDYFCQNYILPMGAAIWSTSLNEMQQFELAFFVRFFHHHGLLNISDRPQWYVVPGGSREYLAPLINNFKDNIQLNSQIKSVTRANNSVQLHFADGSEQQFDEVVFACHSDQALALLGDASADEHKILGAMPYQMNDVVLHTDTSVLPKRKAAWASWNYSLNGDSDSPAHVTYNMNILQGLNSTQTFCVTLNQTQSIHPEKILGAFQYAHPVFNQSSISAQQQRLAICGIAHTHYVGAYWYNGFHEDGVHSATDVAKRFGISL
ncbi:NAD(P)/FAD-dependent oxidoreductase [Paraglaciecola hydrolytica]|uniref:FAD-dependent oxidoreductase n=1 Tax=Paraglaciecola hydrolytica TaxID=1799789 RepID=A0A136A3Y2_9ALTE|nr:FAD-dependent oxidoreductase [Paraglaciecola hydrolytica]KXI29931.1 FAD-dependent oxidoreductase [Paraglaciecola hydrolytica]